MAKLKAHNTRAVPKDAPRVAIAPSPGALR
jgi:hypothetical protein